ncbi:MAG: fumarate hydratase [Methanobacterium sp.]|nr:MAG: fumarate hydratase [Methanobacterium sp.]
MEFKLKTPLKAEDIGKLNTGDVVYLSGTIYTARDRAHQRIIQEGAPHDLEGSVIFHAGPIIKIEKNKNSTDSLKVTDAEMVAVGPTTSTRMNPFQRETVERGVLAVIGKGGMDDDTSQALVENNAVYLAAVGGCAALYVKTVKSIKNVHWLDLGVPEAIWELEVDNFGPLVVAMDSKGSNLYKKVENNIKSRNKPN